jgi:hypothetical protein
MLRTIRDLRGVSRLRDAENVPLICPTCQNVFAGQASMPANPFVFKGFLSLHGVVFDILVWERDRRSQAGSLQTGFQTSFLGVSPLNQASMPSTIWR